ncbi:hypothetical protein HD806DRAFT_502138 [Xylariaceae sp. AK1471]|nr:hypothetical protein HD806DRAFT_502138 [Xylariaceae sp. AK1471]
MIFPTKGHRYKHVVGSEAPTWRPQNWVRIHLIYCAISVVVAITFFYLGQDLADSCGKTAVQKELHLRTVSYIFEQNDTFGQPQSKEVNAAWRDLLPKRGGFFTHPTIAPERSAFAVFHQIHCLDEVTYRATDTTSGMVKVCPVRSIGCEPSPETRASSCCHKLKTSSVWFMACP